MNFSRLAFTMTCLLTFAAITHAHGPQIQITNNDDKIVTRSLFRDGSYDPLTSPVSVYVLPLNIEPNGTYYIQPNDAIDSISGQPAYPSGPGIAYGIGLTFTSGYRFSLSFIDSLKIWDGSTWTDPGTEQIQAYRGSESAPSASAITSDSGPFATLNFSNISATYNSEAHSGASYRLLGDGTDPMSASDDGVYLLSLQLSSNQPGLAASDPFYFVLYKNVGRTEAIAAASSLGIDPSLVQVVPEVGSLTMMGLAGIALGGGMLIRRRGNATNQ